MLQVRFAVSLVWENIGAYIWKNKWKDRLKELLFYLKVLKDTGQSSQKLAVSLKTIKLENGFFKRVDTKIALRKWITCKSFKLLKKAKEGLKSEG